jgi:hypothetical protein
MEQPTSEEIIGGENERARQSFAVVAAERMAAVKDMVGKVASPRVLALVSVLAGSVEATPAEADAALQFNNAFRSAHTQEQFAANMAHAFESLGDEEKVQALGLLGARLGSLYDTTMLAKNEHVALTPEEMFDAMRYRKGTVGICGNIHSYMKYMASVMGMKGMTMTGTLPTPDGGYGGHIYSMVYADIPQSDGSTAQEIVIINYNQVIRTGTIDPAEAIGVYEMESGVPPAFFGEPATLDDGTVIPIHGHASDTLMNLATMDKDSRELLGEHNVRPEKAELSYSFDASLGQNAITLTGPKLSFSLAHFENPGDAFNPIETADSATVGLHQERDTSLGTRTTDFKLNYTHAELQHTVNDGVVDYVALQMATEFQANQTTLMTSEEFGTLYGQFAAGARVGLAFMANGGKGLPLIERAPSVEGDISAQYTATLEKGSNKLYLTLGAQANLLPNNPQEQQITLQPGGYIELGIDTNLIDFEASRYTDGTRYDNMASLSMDFNNGKIGVTYEDVSNTPGNHERSWKATATKNIRGGQITFGAGNEGASLDIGVKF